MYDNGQKEIKCDIRQTTKKNSRNKKIEKIEKGEYYKSLESSLNQIYNWLSEVDEVANR